MPKVSILILNYNGGNLTQECLRALMFQTFRDFEIIVIDNGSSDDSLRAIQEFLALSSSSTAAKLIPLKSNTGFSGGNIEGMKYARGEYIALLNNDTEPDRLWLEELVKAMNTHPEAGICASKMLVYGTGIIDSAGDGFSTLLKGFKHGEGEEAERYSVQKYVFGACAGAALYRRSMIEDIGFLDENFFLIHEDTDLNFRAQLYGWKVVYVPTAVVGHKVRSSIGHMSDMAVYYTLRNSEFVRIKNVPFNLLMRCLPEFILGSIAEFMYFAVKYGKAKMFFKAKRDALRMLPEMLRERKQIMKNKKMSDKYLAEVMTPVWSREILRSKARKLFYG